MSEHPLDKSRKIVERWIIEGTLVLQTPTHLGNGDTDGIVDMPLLLDEVTGAALLPGASLAGALRNYLKERRHGFGASIRNDQVVEDLFGAEKGNDKGSQSPLVIDDALSENPRIELRDGVRIDPATRTAKIDYRNGRPRGYKYDFQLLEAGTAFVLHMELLVAEEETTPTRQALAAALDGLARGEIAIGLRKRRGFGRCAVTEWCVTRYDMTKSSDLLAWIAEDHPDWIQPGEHRSGTDIADLLEVAIADFEDQRKVCHLRAHFLLDGSLLIRSGFGNQDQGPDTVHLHARQGDGARQPVLSGTSQAGVLRHRSASILRTFGGSTARVEKFVDGMFGPQDIKQGDRHGKASRLIVNETVIRDANELVQNRVRIDRFTGGAYESALFNEQPLFGTDKTCVTIDLSLRNPRDAEVGLLLLLLKDLWTGDLPLGGESSIGRGRLQGLDASLALQRQELCHLEAAPDGGLKITGDRNALEGYVAALQKELLR